MRGSSPVAAAAPAEPEGPVAPVSRCAGPRVMSAQGDCEFPVQRAREVV